MKTRKLFNPVTGSSLLMAGSFFLLTSAGPDKNDSFSDWDADKDKKISETELSDGLFSQGKNDAGLFDDDDKDLKGLSDNSFDDEHFYESSYSWWDANNDELLDETEWDFGFENSFGDYLDGEFDTFDADSNGYLDYDEYYDSVAETDYYSDWDSNDDDLLDNDEYAAGVFDTYDANDDDYIDENEFDDWNL